MSDQVRIEFKDIVNALSSLKGLKVIGLLEGPPTRSFPLKEFVEELVRKRIVEVEGYRDTTIVGFKVSENIWIVFHCKSGDIPDDFVMALEGADSWSKLKVAAEELSKITKITFTHVFSAILHGIQGVYIDKGEDIYVVDVEEVADETVNWLPEFFQVE